MLKHNIKFKFLYIKVLIIITVHNNMAMNKYSAHEYISLKYYNFKSLLTSAWHNAGEKNVFNEDIFHDTLLNCLINLNGVYEEADIIRYVYSAFKTNIIREHLYSRNKYKIQDYDWTKCNSSCKAIIDIDIKNLLNRVSIKFGDECKEALILYCNGYFVKEISEKLHIKNIHNKFNKVKQFALDFLKLSVGTFGQEISIQKY